MRDRESIAESVTNCLQGDNELEAGLIERPEVRFDFLIVDSGDPDALNNPSGFFNENTSKLIARFTDWCDIFLPEDEEVVEEDG